MPFGFRLRYFAPAGTCLENDAHEVTFRLPGCPTELSLTHEEKATGALPNSPEIFNIDGDGFATEEAARSVGIQLKKTLSVYSARLGLGFEVGQDRSAGGLAKAVREDIRSQFGVDVRPIINGLDVFDTSIPIKRLRIHATGSVTRPLRNFPESLKTEFKDWSLTEKHTLALSLYNASTYEVDPEARFLSLISVIEVLVHRKPRSEGITSFLSACIKSIDEQEVLAASEQETICNGLGNLKKQSIGEACQELVQSAGGNVELIRRCYKARSELLHDGMSTTFPDLPKQPRVLDELVRKVLIWAVIDGGSRSAPPT
jgi:hypothetical protein